ncbi:MAG TPA: hypothetical protein VJS45_00860 [Acidimicrobiia bacterium]|nr:hypothetical protein [Acidimicrobiia bacterium]
MTFMDDDRITVRDAHRLVGLTIEDGGPLLKAIHHGEIPSVPDPRGEPYHMVRRADVEAWVVSREGA